MNAATCHVTFPTETLVAYWLGELRNADEAAIEDHLFTCGECTARLHSLSELGRDIRSAVRDGDVSTVLPPSFIERLKRTGLGIREYRLQPGGSVMCTVTPEDDLVVAHLQASLRDVQRLDVLYHDLTTGTLQRLEDVAFDATAGEVVMATNVVQLRQITQAVYRVQLVAVTGADEHLKGEYTFNHSAS